jgi:hypothetical protein
MKMYGGMDTQLHAFLTSAPDEDDRSTSHHCYFTSGVKASVPNVEGSRFGCCEDENILSLQEWIADSLAAQSKLVAILTKIYGASYSNPARRIQSTPM